MFQKNISKNKFLTSIVIKNNKNDLNLTLNSLLSKT